MSKLDRIERHIIDHNNRKSQLPTTTASSTTSKSAALQTHVETLTEQLQESREGVEALKKEVAAKEDIIHRQPKIDNQLQPNDQSRMKLEFQPGKNMLTESFYPTEQQLAEQLHGRPIPEWVNRVNPEGESIPETEGIVDPGEIKAWAAKKKVSLPLGAAGCEAAKGHSRWWIIDAAYKNLRVLPPLPPPNMEARPEAWTAQNIRLLCIAKTHEQKHSTKARTAALTWMQRCDGAILMSNVRAKNPPTMALAIEGHESHDNLWHKLRAMVQYTYRNFGDKYDWFFIGDDDTFAVVENLRRYILEDFEVHVKDMADEPLYLGRRFKSSEYKVLHHTRIFVSGGSGHVLNAAALKLLYDVLPFCRPYTQTSADDVAIAVCLQKAARPVFPFDTRDQLGRERFHAYDPNRVYRPDAKIGKPDKNGQISWFVKDSYNWQRDEKQCCSPNSIAFHSIEPDLAQAFDDYLYRCPNDNTKVPQVQLEPTPPKRDVEDIPH